MKQFQAYGRTYFTGQVVKEPPHQIDYVKAGALAALGVIAAWWILKKA